MQKIAVIGAGTMGNGIAHVFAMKGFSVQIIDISESSLEKAISTITKNLDRMVAKGSIDESIKMKTLTNLAKNTSLESGVKNADLVIEAATENEGLKLKIFNQLDEFTDSKTI